MTDEQRQEIMRRQAEGMRAMSKEEMARRQLEARLDAQGVLVLHNAEVTGLGRNRSDDDRRSHAGQGPVD